MTPIRRVRVARGLTLVELAAYSGVGIKTVRRLDVGRDVARIRVWQLFAVAKVLGVSCVDLVPGLERRPPGGLHPMLHNPAPPRSRSHVLSRERRLSAKSL